MRPALVLVPRPPIHPEEVLPAKRHRIFRVAAVMAVAFATTCGLLWRGCSEGKAVERMPAAERRALLERTMENLATVCEPHPDGLHDWCQGEADLAIQIPECDKVCRSLAARQLSRVQAPR